MDTWIIGIIVAIAVGYLLHHVWSGMKSGGCSGCSGGGCSGCPSATSCCSTPEKSSTTIEKVGGACGGACGCGGNVDQKKTQSGCGGCCAAQGSAKTKQKSNCGGCSKH